MEGDEDWPAIWIIIMRMGPFGRDDVFTLRLPNVRRQPGRAAITLNLDTGAWLWGLSDSPLRPACKARTVGLSDSRLSLC
jgi:hypothetical protein